MFTLAKMRYHRTELWMLAFMPIFYLEKTYLHSLAVYDVFESIGFSETKPVLSLYLLSLYLLRYNVVTCQKTYHDRIKVKSK